MNESHRDKVLELSKAFYCSDALDHEVPMNIIETNIDAAISGDKGLIGFVFCEDNEVVGFSYVTTYYETEVGGICVQIMSGCQLLCCVQHLRSGRPYRYI